MQIPFLDLKAGYLELKGNLDSAYARVLNSGYWIMGPELKEFERKFADYCEVKHCVGLANGLEAISLLLRVLDVKEGDEVIVPANTYIACWLGITHVGARVVPVEPVEGTYNLNAALIESAITEKTKAIMPVHLYGQPSDMDPIMEIANRYGINVIDDCAQAHGAIYKGKRVGSLAQASAFSFYPSKNLGAIGDGGAITTDSDEIADKIRVIRNYGSRVRYYNEVIGFNSRLDELQAAFLLEKLPFLDEWNNRRRKLAEVYFHELEGISGITLPVFPNYVDPVWHLFVIRVKNRDQVQSELLKRGIQTIIHYPVPPHLSEAYKTEQNWKRGDFQLSKLLADEVLSLPIGPHLSEAEVGHVCSALKEIVKR